MTTSQLHHHPGHDLASALQPFGSDREKQNEKLSVSDFDEALKRYSDLTEIAKNHFDAIEAFRRLDRRDGTILAAETGRFVALDRAIAKPSRFSHLGDLVKAALCRKTAIFRTIALPEGLRLAEVEPLTSVRKWSEFPAAQPNQIRSVENGSGLGHGPPSTAGGQA